MPLNQLTNQITTLCCGVILSSCLSFEQQESQERTEVDYIISSIKEMNELVTSEIQILKSVPYSKLNKDQKDQKKYYWAEFKLIGSIDLRTIIFSNIDIEKRELKVNLPKPNVPRILLVPAERSKVLHRQLFNNESISLGEISKLDSIAIENLRNDILKMSLNDNATNNAETLIRNMFKAVHFTVEFNS